MSITATGITRRFKEVVALNNVSVTFEENRIYGLLGRNGAGKSTLLNILANRVFADEGTVLIDGLDAVRDENAQEKLHLMNEKDAYPEAQRIKEAFMWAKRFHPDFDMDRTKSLCEAFGLNPTKKIKGLSTGYKTIFKLILALCMNTPYILLDEPVLGLDANHRELFYKVLLQKYIDNPCTIIISTHLIEEAASIIEDVIIIKEGEIICARPCEELLDSCCTVSGTAAAVEEYCAGLERIGEDSLGGLKTVYLIGKPDKAPPAGIELSRADLQKLFIRLTNT